jgi:site-specific DNA-methyltransferase (cytosine-N4-specific)
MLFAKANYPYLGDFLDRNLQMPKNALGKQKPLRPKKGSPPLVSTERKNREVKKLPVQKSKRVSKSMFDFQFKTKPYYKTKYGKAFHADTLTLMKEIPDNSIDLILTSPPFALTSQKEYGNKSSEKYVEWFLTFSAEFKRILKPKGSFVVDFGGAYLPGNPIRSLYQYDLLIRMVREQGFFLAQELFHYNPARLPAPAQWVNVKRVRIKDSVNLVWWLSKTENPKADNRNVLTPYSPAMINLIKNGYKAKMRPSGHNITHKFQKDNNGAIPPNLLELGNNESNSQYILKCKQFGIRPHPARFPWRFADFFIKFLTDKDDIVFDPFAGSNTTGWVAEGHHRRWIGSELEEDYLKASKFRFEDSPEQIIASK